MTLIVGIEHEGTVYMGADCGLWYENGFEESAASPKLFHLGPLLIGVAGAHRSGNIVRYALTDLPPLVNADPQAYLVREFIPRLRQALNDGGALCKQTDGSDSSDSDHLIAAGGFLFNVSDALCVMRGTRGYSTVGHPLARGVAMGSLSATAELPPQIRIQKALEAAAEHTDAARAPFAYAEHSSATRALAVA